MARPSASCVQRTLMRLVEDDLAVDFVGEDPQVVALGQVHELAH